MIWTLFSGLLQDLSRVHMHQFAYDVSKIACKFFSHLQKYILQYVHMYKRKFYYASHERRCGLMIRGLGCGAEGRRFECRKTGKLSLSTQQ